MEQAGRSVACDEVNFESISDFESGSVTTIGGVKHSGANNDDSETGETRGDVIEPFLVDTGESKKDGDFGFKGEAGGVKSPTRPPLSPSNFFSLAGNTHL